MIKYKLLKTSLTGTVYPQQVETQSFTHDDLEELLRKRLGSIAPAVLNEAVQIISEKLACGNTVSIDGLGTFSIRLGMDKRNVTEYEDVRTQDIRISGVRFNAGKELREALGGVEIHVQHGAKVKREMTTDQRWVMIYDYMLQETDRSGFATMSSTIYQTITGCTAYTARKELEQFVAQGKLRAIPARRVKLYVLSTNL